MFNLLRIVLMAGLMIGTVSAGFGDEDDDDDEPKADGAVTLVTVGRLPIAPPADLTASAIANA